MSREKIEAEAARWLAQANADLRAAAASTAAGSHEWASFQAQQAGEKALKSLWIAHGHEGWGHSLVRLVREWPGRPAPEGLADLLPDARRLDQCYVPTRYPNGLPELTPAEVFGPEDARGAMEAARRVISLVERLRTA